ncbi:hypothetical protein GNI_155050 [Gregarina niphandrodes]|uniref:Uncharacterized protein n=1 Tax=Gregarina niphandrodes TaxID=110365 RepID=A0A023AZ84_GRENI|nr:hypothetical protein GNI_155050 [Gregarina niphandrodes]EZG43968.1 hypothetical protein GNI_155050 [Gregarina niphandrodes]|eukprot:XP_011132870.1 hypothetical protein GNI_155050 [Gregarina niphandrodes]
MRTFKSEASGVPGGELLSVLIRPDGSQTKLDNCVAQVVTIRTGGGGEVTALVLAPKTAFEAEIETVDRQIPLMMDTTSMVEGENYDWFQQWDRMMVWRPKEGPPSDDRAEATLLAALRRRLTSRGPRDMPEAVETLCHEVFGERLRDLHALLSGSGEMQGQDEIDDVTVDVARPIDPSELTELLARVPKDWMPVLQRSAEWKTVDWKTEGCTDIEAAEAKRSREMKSCRYKTAGILGLGAAALIVGSCLLRFSGSAQRPTAEQGLAVPGTYAQFSDNRGAAAWAMGPGMPAPVATCGSGILRCDTGCKKKAPWPVAFGSPWPLTFPLAWDIAHRTLQVRMPTCRVRCNTEEESAIALEARLLSQFPLQTPFNTTMSKADEVRQIVTSLSTAQQTCKGLDSWEAISRLTHCACDLAAVGCEVMTKGNQKTHDVVLSDLEAPLARVAASFADYPSDVYEVKKCAYDCWELTPEVKQTAIANRAATAAYQATSTSTTATPGTRATRKRARQKIAKYPPFRISIG